MTAYCTVSTFATIVFLAYFWVELWADHRGHKLEVFVLYALLSCALGFSLPVLIVALLALLVIAGIGMVIEERS